jgi:drug/metabolite transporter (DMT)-like permease
MAGVLWMAASGLCFVGVATTVRLLGPEVPAAQSAFLRFAIGLLVVAPALWTLARRGVPAGVWPLVGARAVAHVAAVVLWFHAMARLPVAEVTAIGYLNPVLVTLGAGLLLGEGFAPRRLLALAAAVLGALVILRPGLRPIEPAHWAQVGAATCFAVSYLFAARIGQRLPAGAVVALLSVTVTLGLAPFAAAVWVPVGGRELGLLALVAALASGGHYAMSRAFAAAPVTLTQPVIFLQLVWATLVGVSVFGDPVDPAVLAGGGVILAAVSALTWREARLRRQAIA